MYPGRGMHRAYLVNTKIFVATDETQVIRVDSLPNSLAASLAQSRDITIYAIGVGTNGMAPVRISNPRTGRSQIQTMPVRIDDELLESISTQTGGRYFRATNQEGLKQIVATIDALEKTTLEDKRYREYTEYYPMLLLFGLFLMSVSIVLRNTVFRRVV